MLTAFANHSFLHWKITLKNALNQPECGDLQLAQVQIYLSVEIDPSNNSLRFTHNPSVEKLLAAVRSGANIPELGKTPSNNSFGLEHSKEKHNTHFTHSICVGSEHRGMNCYIREPSFILNNSVRHAHCIR